MTSDPVRPAARHVGVLAALFFTSGFAALVYQVLWVRELGLLFGSTAQAAALTIAIFFAGIAAGGWFWGRRASQLSSSLRWFGILELGVAATALGYFILVDAYVALYPALFRLVEGAPAFDVLSKALVATLVLFPPAFLMGGTLPLLGQHLIRERRQLGTSGSKLYALNTSGSAVGALAAGFGLPLVLGFPGTYLLAVGLDVAVGLAALRLAHREALAAEPSSTAGSRAAAPAADVALAADVAPTQDVAPTPAPALAPTPPPATSLALPGWLIWTIAIASGVTTLAIEVLWTRLFAQVLQNSAYTYALVLSTFLLALALGSVVANLLNRWRSASPEFIVAGLLLASGAVTTASPWLFHSRTDGLRLLGADLAFGPYVLSIAGTAAVVMLLPGIVLGAVLPYLLRVLQSREGAPGDTIGRLVAGNTAGGIVGSLLAGFVLLPLVGAWRSLLWLAAVYPTMVAGMAVTRLVRARAGVRERESRPRGWRALIPTATTGLAGACVVAVIALLLVPADLTTVHLDPDGSESLVEVREGTQATVAVIADGRDRFLRVNNHYTLGGTRALDAERNQSLLPLLAHPDPREVFFLGVGTGITAGASLASDAVERVQACELVDEVVRLSETHFEPWIAGLYDDPRAEVHAEDGRTCLARSDDTYDLIVSDLFTPWKAGTGNLYTRDHYATARDRLHDGGRYVQWMPLYQVSERELAMVANTMDDVFDQVTLWRGDLYSTRSIVALVGEDDPEPIDPGTAAERGRELLAADDPDRDLPDRFFEALLLRMYVGNVTESGLFADAELNTDARPRVEHLAPRTQRQVRAGEAEFLTGPVREDLYERFRVELPPEDDPALAGLNERQRGYVEAGASYSVFRFLNHIGADDGAEPWLDAALERSPPEARSPDDMSPAGRLLPRVLLGRPEVTAAGDG